MKETISHVRKAKTEKQMSMKDPIPELIIPCPAELGDLYRKSEKDIMACTGAEKVLFRF